MVVVRVGDEDRVEPPRIRGHRRQAAQVADARAQDGVGEQPRAVDLEQRRGVPEPGDATGRVHDPILAPAGPRRLIRHG